MSRSPLSAWCPLHSYPILSYHWHFQELLVFKASSPKTSLTYMPVEPVWHATIIPVTHITWRKYNTCIFFCKDRTACAILMSHPHLQRPVPPPPQPSHSNSHLCSFVSILTNIGQQTNTNAQSTPSSIPYMAAPVAVGLQPMLHTWGSTIKANRPSLCSFFVLNAKDVKLNEQASNQALYQ